MAKKLHFEMYWVGIGQSRDVKQTYEVFIRIRQSSDITWSNSQGYRDKTDAMRAIMSLIEAVHPITAAIDMDRFKISGPGKKPS